MVKVDEKLINYPKGTKCLTGNPTRNPSRSPTRSPTRTRTRIQTRRYLTPVSKQQT